MKNMLEILKKAECLHDAERNVTKTTDPAGDYTTEYRCSKCGSILYETRLTIADMMHQDTILDDVYYMLYRRVGRLKLLASVLEEEGIPIPSCWNLKP